MPFDSLPDDCMRRILYYLGGEGIVRVHKVNQALHRLARVEALHRMRRRPLRFRGYRLPLPLPVDVEDLFRRDEGGEGDGGGEPLVDVDALHLADRSVLYALKPNVPYAERRAIVHLLFRPAVWTWERLPCCGLEDEVDMGRTEEPPHFAIVEVDRWHDSELGELLEATFWKLEGGEWVETSTDVSVSRRQRDRPMFQSGDAYDLGLEVDGDRIVPPSELWELDLFPLHVAREAAAAMAARDAADAADAADAQEQGAI